MDKQYTSGPWKVTKTDDYYFGIISSYNEWVAKCSPLANSAGNANLIAAAPELLEALESVIDSWQYGESIVEAQDTYRKAQIAIKKAKGEE